MSGVLKALVTDTYVQPPIDDQDGEILTTVFFVLGNERWGWHFYSAIQPLTASIKQRLIDECIFSFAKYLDKTIELIMQVGR